MNCKDCKIKTKTLETRTDRSESKFVNKPGTVFRRRECPDCGRRFNTTEIHQDDLDALVDNLVEEKMKKSLRDIKLIMSETALKIHEKLT